MPQIDKEERKLYNKQYYLKRNMCEHNRRKTRCKECGGVGICEHNIQKYTCKECGGSGICEHNRQKSRCKECKGSQICEHNTYKSTCKDCSFQTYLIYLQTQSINRLFKKPTIKFVNHTIEYLGCDSDFFLDFFQSKMIDGMTLENIHMDHIKPISKFNLEDHDEFLKCCHYTNLQPLLPKDNMIKFNKWTEDDEIFWNENIIYKNYTKLYF